ncbi:DUF4402 domain-containing protein [Salinispirillum sp. LH 10-3-1]|uniref:DUF4402 domain-containing protein n=1 Tax=Salinispirillum sp. LH 10-3-1 TaxID=2952525 RepID=A0AB38YDU1_9GAMM
MKNLMTQNTLFRRAALTSAVVAGGLMAVNGMAADDDADISATVVVPITIDNVVDMNFGSFSAPTGAASTITLGTGGGLTPGAGVVVIDDTAAAAARFDISGLASQAFSITIAATVTLTETVGGVATMDLTTSWDDDGAAENNAVSSSLDVVGEASVFIGGELAVAQNQLAGDYAGTVNAAFEYE